MKVSVAVLGPVLGMALLAPAAFADPGPAEGKTIYETRCSMCHASGMANAPLLEKLQALEPTKVLEALTTPVPMMQGVVASLSEQDKRDVAVYLTKKGLPAKDGLPEVKPE
jgi:cytochrome c553